MHTPPVPGCGTLGSLNVMPLVRRLIPTFRPRALHNAVLQTPTSTPALPAEISQALIGWGQHVATAHALQEADRRLPGISGIHQALQVCQALSAIRRGDLPGTLCHIPIAFVLSALDEDTVNALPRVPGALAQHDAIIMLIAAALWMTQPPQAPSRVPLSTSRRLLLASLTGIRMLSTAARAISHHQTATTPDVCDNGYCLDSPAGPLQTAQARNQTAAFPTDSPHACCGIAVAGRDGDPFWPSADHPWFLPGVSAGRKGPPRAVRPKGPARSTRTRNKAGVTVRRNRKPAPSAPDNSGPLQSGKSDAFLIRGAARNSAAMAGHAHAAHVDGLPGSMMGPLTHSSSVVFKTADEEDRRRQEGEKPFRLAPATSGPESTLPGPAGVTVPLTASTSRLSADRCVAFHTARETYKELRALREQSAPVRYCMHPRAEERFTTALSFAGGALPVGGAPIVAHPIREIIPPALRSTSVQIVRRTKHAWRAHPAEHGRLGHRLIYAVVTIALLDRPSATDLHEHDAMALLRNTFRLMEYEDIGGSRHLYIAYMIADEASATHRVAAGIVPVDVDDEGGLSVKDARHDWTISAPDLPQLLAVLEDVSGLVFDPGPHDRHREAPDVQRRIVPEKATNLWVTEEEQLAWSPPHDRLPYDPTLGLLRPVVIAESEHHPALELYANSFTIVGESLVYADDKRNAGVLRFGCPMTQGSGRVLQCPASADPVFARKFQLQDGYVYNLELLARQLEEGGMVRMPDSAIQTDAKAAGGALATPGVLAELPTDTEICASCYTFNEGRLHYVDPHGNAGGLTFDPVPGRRDLYLLADTQTPENRRFAFETGLEWLRGYTEDEIVMCLAGEGYERVAIEPRRSPRESAGDPVAGNHVIVAAPGSPIGTGSV